MQKFVLLNGKEFSVYEDSIQKDVCMIDAGREDLVVSAPGLGFAGELVDSKDGKTYVFSRLNHATAESLRKLFPWTAPSRVLGRDKTMGVGDRLGVAGDGHIRVFKKFPEITPILAQQSIRELTLTNRTFADVLDSATFAVFRNGFTTGWGADGDHVKTAEEVEYALTSGYTMITMDCSEHIDNTIEALSSEEVNKKYVKNAELEALYLGKSFDIGNGVTISFDEDLFRRTVLIYAEAVDYAEGIYKKHVAPGGVARADFEVSIDETMTPTIPAQHFFVSSELTRRGVKVATVAPRFCGEFQKGIDYIGDLDQFEREMRVHAQIARHFGYKLSIHSGSDKFSAFPSSGRETQGRFHLKTAGTNWLEAVRLIAVKDPALYRGIHKYALEAFKEASKYYHVTTDLTKIPDIDTLTDAQLPDLFKNNDSRQLIHITYGLILNLKDEFGRFVFKDRMYSLWRTYREDYAEYLFNHIGHHASAILLK